MKKLLIAASSLALFAAPAQAQLLGGSGGLGGMVGGTLGGASPIGGTLDNVRGTIGSTADARGSTSGSQRVDRRSGRVEANRRADANTSANSTVGVAPLVDNSIGPVTGQFTRSGSASGEGGASAQVIGTDAVASLAGQARTQAQGTVSSGRATAAGLVTSSQGAAGQAAGMAGPLAGSVTGSAAGSASGNGEATGDIGSGLASATLAAAGSGAANGDGAFAVAPGMDVFGSSGEKIGEVRQVIADSRGTVSEVVVKQSGQDVTYPAASLQGAGSALFAAEGNAAVQ